MKLKTIKFVLLVAAVLLLGGCAAMQKAPEEEGPAPVIETQPPGLGESGAERGGDAATSGMERGAAWTGSPLENPDSPLYTRVIHFDFDRSEIKPEWRDIVVAHGRYLAQNPSVTVVIEGHCDERGSREYNIGLGERRANAVKRLLLAEGAMQSQITTISYGEERPVAFGSDEASWAQNRRAVFVY